MTPSSPPPTEYILDGDTDPHRPTKAAPGKVAPTQPTKIPVSVYAPVSLARPLSMFGKTFEVHLSASCTLNPDTALQAVMDTSLLTFLRTEKPLLLQYLKILLYAGTGKHRPSRTTRDVILASLPLLDSEALACVLDGRVPAFSPPHSDWRFVLQGMGNRGSDIVSDIVSDLAVWDDQALHIRELTRVGDNKQASVLVRALIDPGLQAWAALNPGLLQAPQVLLLVESSLQTLARLVCRIDMPSLDLPSRESSVTQLLETGRRPLGHWLHEVQLKADCTNLLDLANCLFGVDAKHHDRPISHDLLKKWSSSKNVVLPPTAVQPVLLSIRIRESRQRLQDRYYMARFLTFLCDLTWAGIPGKAPVWGDIQAQIKSRYRQVYQLEAANWPAPLAAV